MNKNNKDYVYTSSPSDPLSISLLEESTSTLKRLDQRIFAEPLQLMGSKLKNETTEEFIFYDFATVQKKGQRKKYHMDIHDVKNPRCPQENCSKAFPNLRLLKQHIRKVHCSDQSRFECASCTAKFSQKYLLVRHLAIHDNQRQECPICHKKLSVRTQLPIHLKAHETNKEFSCEICSKSFNRRATLKTHLKYVHRTTEIECEKCHTRFKKRKDLHSHLSQIHGKVKCLECEICGHVFSTFGALGSHKAKKHQDLY